MLLVVQREGRALLCGLWLLYMRVVFLCIYFDYLDYTYRRIFKHL